MPVHRVTVLPAGLQFEADETRSLMEAALLAGIRLPVSCRNGTCRTCICRLRDGSIRHRIEWPGLTPEEKAENWILPCVAVAQSDVTIEVPGARTREMQGKVSTGDAGETR